MKSLPIFVAILCLSNAYADDTAITSSRAYVTNELDGRQDKITAKSGDKIVTYPSTLGGVPNERAIVSNMSGTTTSDTGVPTAGAVKTRANTKQDNILNIPNNNVVTMDYFSGRLGSRHIYANANGKRFGDGLVEAQTVNVAAVAAMNSKFTKINESGTADSNGQLWRINVVSAPITVDATLDANILGTGTACYRSFSAKHDANGTCSENTLNHIGAVGSKSGKWGVVFPYGEVTGDAVCSELTPPDSMKYDNKQSGTFKSYNSGYVATLQQNTALDTSFEAQSGVSGNISSTNRHCWCKTDSPRVSSWVFFNTYDVLANCRYFCPESCASSVRNSISVRGALFGSAQ